MQTIVLLQDSSLRCLPPPHPQEQLRQSQAGRAHRQNLTPRW